MLEPNFLYRELVEFLHNQAIDQYDGNPGILDENLLESALNRPRDKYHYAGPGVDIFDLAASYAFGFVKNHAFFDANKRTGWASCVTFLLVNNITVTVPTHKAVNAMLDLANNKISEESFAEWLRRESSY